MTIKYKYFADETGQVRNLVFTPPNYVLEEGWKVGDCVNDELPDINTLHEQKYLDAQALIQYKEDRQAEYPSIADVTIALAEKMEGKDQMWDEITALRLDVKSRFPKP